MRSPRRVSRDETSPVTVTSAVIVTETAARMTCPSPPAACTDIAPCQVGAGVPSAEWTWCRCPGTLLALLSGLLFTGNNFVVNQFSVAPIDLVLVRSALQLAVYTAVCCCR